MKTLFTVLFKALMFLTCVLILGMFIPFIVAVITYWVYPVFIPFRACIGNPGFLIFSVAGIIIAWIYIINEIETL